MVSFMFGVGGVDNSHDCILLIQLHHLSFSKCNPHSYTEFYTWGNYISNKTVLLKAKILFNQVQCFRDDLGKLEKNLSLNYFPYTSEEQLEKLQE